MVCAAGESATGGICQSSLGTGSGEPAGMAAALVPSLSGLLISCAATALSGAGSASAVKEMLALKGAAGDNQ